MDFFKSLNTLEDGVRRGKLEKAGTEKMGVPQVLGAGERPEILSDSAKEREESETDVESSEKCEKNSDLMGAIGFLSAAFSSRAVSGNPVEKRMPADQRARMQEQHPEMRGEKKPKSARGAEWQAAAAEESKKKEGKKSKKSKKSSKKSSKKPSKKTSSAGDVKGKSGSGSGQAGRTGSRKRRSVGEFWWAKSGNRPGLDLWTKREGGSIVRANKEERKKYMAERKERGLEGKVDIETGPEDEHKKRSMEVKKIKETYGLVDHLSKEDDLMLTEKIVAAGLATPKQKEKIRRIKETILAYKLSLGKPSRWARTPEQVKRDYVDGLDVNSFKDRKEFNRVKERIEKMSIKDFDIMMRSIEFDEDEDVLREEFGIQGSWKGAPKVKKSFDDALEDIIKSMGW